MKSVLVTGGAGFVGGNLAVALKNTFADVEVTAIDNLSRHGSALGLPRLREHGVCFRHGDIRCREDLDGVPAFDLLIDCSAEPSVLAGLEGSPMAVVQNNLAGTVNCMEAARRHDAAFLFLSTSRVYPIAHVNALEHRETESRFEWTGEGGPPGFSKRGVAEGFPLDGARSFYGATKLASELLLQEYAYSYSMPVLINRCGILTGPWQMGKVDQGVVTLWVARHIFGRPLQYMGFGGTGKQVRDLLHIDDFFQLVVAQLGATELWDGRVYNVGGGRGVSVSLVELDGLCKRITGARVPVTSRPESNPVDVRIYITDAARVQEDFGWRPERSAAEIVEDVSAWIRLQRQALEPVLG